MTVEKGFRQGEVLSFSLWMVLLCPTITANIMSLFGFHFFLKDIFLNHAVSHNILLILWVTFGEEVISLTSHQ